jgi:hypothetical protein
VWKLIQSGGDIQLQPALKNGKKTATENDDEVADTPSKKAHPSKSSVVNSQKAIPGGNRSLV